ncbi:hypothetical protein Cgig2_013660 [Carnegiea gigantea]|uniref:Uncharacterized protein n=1 Tax=Carnegiea gigantea TaxID=171969 RepID=A0A9Q1JW33_9CARY|nr:hypothetical protein Cgig2_013660 [Carnegiea gigantea]
MLDIQQKLDKDPFNKELAQVESQEVLNFKRKNDGLMKFLQQKAKINWCKYGNTNSSFFHGCIKARIQRNRIYEIQNSQGIKVAGFDQVGKAFVQYYSEMPGNESTATGAVEQFKIDCKLGPGYVNGTSSPMIHVCYAAQNQKMLSTCFSNANIVLQY